MKFRDWSLWRVLALCVAWPLLLLAIVIARIGVALRNEPPDVRRGVILPPQLSDFRFSVESPSLLALVVLGPPALVMALWLWRRRTASV